MIPAPWLHAAMAIVLLAPASAVVLIATATILGFAHERWVRRVTGISIALVLAALIVLDVAILAHGERLAFHFGTLRLAADHEFPIALVIDRVNAGWLLVSALILGVVARFCGAYLHREPGFVRFSGLFWLFAFALFLLETAASIDLFFAGWELIGLASVLLVAFFWERDKPVERALYTFIIYRICDLGLLAGVVLLHHWAHHADGGGLAPHQANVVGLLFLVAAAGKSAQFPVTGWLPRAMEGPTPSSALFYGALSVHTGAFLLIRMSPVLEDAPVARAFIVAVGATTAITATLTGRTHCDAKNVLAYATVAQVGLMFIEIGLGFHRLALVHMLANALLRSFQFLRAGSGLADHLRRTATIGPKNSVRGPRHAPRLYWLAMRRFYVEETFELLLLRPVAALARAIDRVQTALEARLFGADDA